jgi:hypothetical protein
MSISLQSKFITQFAKRFDEIKPYLQGIPEICTIIDHLIYAIYDPNCQPTDYEIYIDILTEICKNPQHNFLRKDGMKI